tara:strand:- start:2346 stop:2768 length:423 start_codon:yes stop_codon:yes gene_type:complete
MSISGALIVEEARRYLGTPHLHQGRHPSDGLDCIGLMVVTCQALGITDYDSTAYPPDPDGVTLMREIRKIAYVVDESEAREGDVIVFWIDDKTKPRHIGFKTDKGFIHTFAGGPKRVVEHGFSSWWTKRICCYMRLEGVT